MKNKTLIILGHPDKETFCGALAQKYLAGAQTAHKETKIIYLGDLQFDPILRRGYKQIQELEPDLRDAQEKIKWADHLVWIFPTWWFTYPALVKGFLDRTLLPGFAFNYKDKSPLPQRHLKGKTSEIISTMDAPPFIYILMGDFHKKLMGWTLNFCGIKLIKSTYFGSVKKSTSQKREKWLNKAYDLGRKS